MIFRWTRTCQYLSLCISCLYVRLLVSHFNVCGDAEELRQKLQDEFESQMVLDKTRLELVSAQSQLHRVIQQNVRARSRMRKEVDAAISERDTALLRLEHSDDHVRDKNEEVLEPKHVYQSGVQPVHANVDIDANANLELQGAAILYIVLECVAPKIDDSFVRAHSVLMTKILWYHEVCCSWYRYNKISESVSIQRYIYCKIVLDKIVRMKFEVLGNHLQQSSYRYSICRLRCHPWGF